MRQAAMRKALLIGILAGSSLAVPHVVLAAEPVAADAPAADPMFSQPYVDIDEWRDKPVRHRYVHGGFKGTEARFSLYMPPKEKFERRFFQYVTPVPDSENLAPTNGLDQIGFSIDSGGYFVETNSGGTNATAGPAFNTDPKIAAFRANAAAAQYSRVIASEMYGAGKIYGYLYGGSGGGYRTLGSMENTKGVWDGAVPFVLGSPMAAPNSFTIRMHAMRILNAKFPQIIDAVDAGGSGDPYKGLNAEEAAALKEATAMGFPLKAWFNYDKFGVHAFTALYQGMVMADPTYFEDFWTKPGYLGFNPPESLKKARLQFVTKIRDPLDEDEATAKGMPDLRIPGTSRGTAEDAWRIAVNDGSKRTVAFELEGTPPDVGFLGGDLVVLSGEAKGAKIAIRLLKGNIATLGVTRLGTVAKIKPGDEVRVDNSNFLAAQTFHRHQVPDASYKVYDQFRGPDGKPLYPQRKMLLGPMFAQGAAGTVPTGRFNGKIITVNSLLDREAVPWHSDWYRRKFDEHYGADAVNRYRIWYTENALHGAQQFSEDPTRVINYNPMLEQALRDVAAWVEKGVSPPQSTNYKVIDGQVIPAATAATRGSVQPVVTLKVNGAARAVVKAGQRVNFVTTISVPPGTGKVVGVEWDFDSSGKFAEKALLKAAAQTVTLTASHAFAKPGTYFVAMRAFSHRTGNMTTPYARIPNLGRVRVVVK
ncbi:PKD domain-containing protein [Novosphingobium aquae]|uniref:PKD domain-containing protein n=1 Tax=Novosphingobium aquae TaxID=3133435 RepID=A0ABU8SE28_9SPHN